MNKKDMPVKTIAVPAYNSHATPNFIKKLEEYEYSLKEGKILEYHPIKSHVPLLMLRPAKSIPFLCCQSTSEAECYH